MAQMWQYAIFLSLKPSKVTSDFILNYLKKVVGGATTQKYQKQTQKTLLQHESLYKNSTHFRLRV